MTGGARYERELVNSLDAVGYSALRLPSSGSATARDLPDVLASTRVDLRGLTVEAATTFSDAIAVEVKSTSETTAYADEAEIEALARFASEWGATPYLAGRFKGGSRSPHYLVRPTDARRTDSGNYGVPECDAEERAELLVWPETPGKDARLERLDGGDGS